MVRTDGRTEGRTKGPSRATHRPALAVGNTGNQSAEGAVGLGMLMSTIIFWSGVMSTFDFESGDYVQVCKKEWEGI